VSISYPLILPASPPGLASVEMIGESLAGIAASPFTAQQQIYEWPGQFWRAKCSLPPMARVNAERWISFLLSLRGITGTFLLGDPLGKTPQGTAGGSPIVSGAGQAGKTLAISGLTGALKAGDYFHIGSAGENSLLWSQDFTNAAWIKTGTIVNSTSIVGPDGNSYTTIEINQNVAANGFMYQLVTDASSPGSSYTFSVWIKSGTLTGNIALVIRDGVQGNPGIVTVTPTGTWTRYSVSTTLPPSAAPNVIAMIDPVNNAGTGTYYLWGAQLERGLVVNNYIPTTSLVSGPTRQLLKNLTDAGPGSVTLDIFPKLRTSPLNADPLILTNSVGMFRLTSNSTPWTADKAKFYGISFEAVEAL